jgi:SnoaL-like domain
MVYGCGRLERVEVTEMGDDAAKMEVRLQRLEDLEEIRRLFEDYGYHLDREQWHEYAALYAKDGQMRLGPVRADGPVAIETAAREGFGGGGRGGQGTIREGGLGGLHVVGSPRIQLDGDRATAEVMWVVIVRDGDGKPVVSSAGHHLDDLVREAGRWRFQKRRGFMDIP